MYESSRRSGEEGHSNQREQHGQGSGGVSNPGCVAREMSVVLPGFNMKYAVENGLEREREERWS